MEWIKNRSLIKTFFIITILAIWLANMLSFLLVDMYNFHALLPTLLNIGALLISAVLFYRLKLKKPLDALQDGIEKIQNQDLDFSIEKQNDDELGRLCAAFETMRLELIKSNRELWRQVEERKRLNVAFSHDLRNPVTVLKGSAAILEKKLGNDENLLLIKQYTERIEKYIEVMASVQKLEDLICNRQAIYWEELLKELENSLLVLGADMGLEMNFHFDGKNKQVEVDKFMIFNTAENLAGNALRYARSKIGISLTYDNEKITMVVTDDGQGFSDLILNKGIIPFLRDDNNGQDAHFGMGLYICSLLCQKHGGLLKLENHLGGAKVTATFFFKS